MVQKLIDIYPGYYNFVKVGNEREGSEGEWLPARTPMTALGMHAVRSAWTTSSTSVEYRPTC